MSAWWPRSASVWRPTTSSAAAGDDDREARELLRCLAVAGFAAANVMLLSVAVWSGHDGSMGDATRTLFHWLSAAIALPAVAYAGRPFFRSAFAALKAGRTNMDVPISIGVMLACIVSLHETWVGGQHAYFDSAITLLFFLLIGRYLDRRARGRARQAVRALLALSSRSATVLAADGSGEPAPGRPAAAGRRAAGGRRRASGRRRRGDGRPLGARRGAGQRRERAAVGRARRQGLRRHGQSRRAAAREGDRRRASARCSPEIVRLVEAAERGRSRFVALADRVARAYAPVVHATALLTFLGWMLLGGLAWDRAPADRHRGADHHLPLRAGAGGARSCRWSPARACCARGVLLLSPTALERLGDASTMSCSTRPAP